MILTRKKVLAISTLIISLFTFAAPVTAATSTAGLKPGPLSINAPTIASDFTATTLNGDIQTLYATLSNWSVIDATGAAKGWNVTVQASQLTEVLPNGSNATPLTLPIGSIALSGNREITAGRGSNPVDASKGPVIANPSAAIDVSSPVKLVDTQPKYGKGTYNIIEPSGGLSLTIQPKDTELDSVNYPNTPTPFSTTITYSITTGP